MRSVCSGSADGFEDTPGRPLTAVARVTIIARKPDNQETCERLRVSENGATPGGEISVRVDVPCTLSDGTVLRANVYSPVTDEAVPVLLLRHPYSKDAPMSMRHIDVHRAVLAGYIVVTQDVRGRYASDGEFTPSVNEQQDGYEA